MKYADQACAYLDLHADATSTITDTVTGGETLTNAGVEFEARASPLSLRDCAVNPRVRTYSWSTRSPWVGRRDRCTV